MKEILYGDDGYADRTRIAMALHRWKHAGAKVHIIFDADHVLVSGRSHDVFDIILSREVEAYRSYEARMFLQLMDEGPWTSLARQVGERFTSQDIVTARAGYSALRVMFFCLAHRLDFHDMLFVGGQSKATSYGEILKRFKDAPEWQVLMLDDSPRHVEDFNRVAEEMGMTDRCYPLLTHRERPYTQGELQRHFDDVMRDSEEHRPFIAHDGAPETLRHFLVVPDAHAAMLRMLQNEADDLKSDLSRRLIHILVNPEPKRGYDAVQDAYRQAKAELETLTHRDERSPFFDRLGKNDGTDKKRGYDALVEANRRANEELRSIIGPPESSGDWYEASDLGDPPPED